MTNEEIIEGNNIIGEYVGIDFSHPSVFKHSNMKFRELLNDRQKQHGLLFHRSWDWLMLVVGEIEEYVYEEIEQDGKMVPDKAFMRTFHGNMARINRMGLHEAETQIQAVWLAVTSFIKWYNSKI